MELMRYYQLNEALKKEKKKLNKNLLRKNKKLIFILDILVIVAILFNVGAMMTTNALVVRENPEKEFKEANPIAAKNNNFVAPPKPVAMVIMTGFYIQAIGWIVLIGLYLYNRQTFFKEEGLWGLAIIALIIFVFLGLDFLSNLGYYIGKILYGG